MKDQRWSSVDEIIAENRGKTIEQIVAEEAAEGGPWLISRDELLAAGALYVPPAQRKSLRVERDLFADVSEDASPPSPSDVE